MLAEMVVLLATGIVPPVVAALLAADAMILLRVVSVQQSYRGISWTTVLLVAGMIPMSTAITVSGGYRFGDYWKLGLPMIGLCFALAVGLVPLVWSF